MEKLDKYDVSEFPRWSKFKIVSRGIKSKPFLINPRAYLIHRPASITIYEAKFPMFRYQKGEQIIAAKTLCGATFDKHDIKYADEIPKNSVVCFRCEAEAIRRNKKQSSELLGYQPTIAGAGALKHKNRTGD